ncbi:hypothetical protein DL93DRAFT_2173205 [Clavulina sp. PMI_390]|nr:hypothetical protein DL93DRAFT_2173205 [Clavulina sp. PMI_390]
MLVQRCFWDDLHNAQEDLFQAISSTLQSPAFTQPQHLLMFLPSAQNQARADINDLKTQIFYCRKRLTEVKKKFQDLDDLCRSANNVLDMATNPIAALPMELLQHIVDLTIRSPRDFTQIIRLSHVSCVWRAAVLGMPALFTIPDWSWPTHTLSEWLSRAGTRPLQVQITIPGGVSSYSQFDKTCQAIIPYLGQVQTIQIDSQSPHYDAPPSFEDFFQRHSLRRLEGVSITGRTPWSLWMDLNSAPSLRTLHVTEVSIALSGGPLQLKSLGWRVRTPEELGHLVNAAASQTTPFHLTIYAHISNSIRQSLSIKQRPAGCWSKVSSLRLHGFCGQDDLYIESLISQLEMPNLVSLELVELNYPVFANVMEALPTVTSIRVERLLIACTDTAVISTNKFLEPLCNVERRGDNNIPLPNIYEFALRDFDAQGPCEWLATFDTLQSFLRQREGILKRFVLPSTLRPSRRRLERMFRFEGGMYDVDNLGVGSTERSLTVDQELLLREAGKLSEVCKLDKSCTEPNISRSTPPN